MADPIATFRAGQIVPPWLVRCKWARFRKFIPRNLTIYADGRKPENGPSSRRFNGRRGQHLLTFGGDSEVYRSPAGFLVVPTPGTKWECAMRCRARDGDFVSKPPVLWHGDREQALNELAGDGNG